MRWLRPLVLLPVIATVACSDPPITVYRNMLASAQLDYEDGFVEGFTVKSQKVVRALLRLADVYGFDAQNPMRLLDSDDAVAEEIHGDLAVVTVTRNGRERPVLFVKDPEADGAWRVDLSEYEIFLKKGESKYLLEHSD